MTISEIDKIFIRLNEKIISIFPHLDKVSIFYKSQDSINQIENGSKIELDSCLITKINTLRNSNLNFQWLLPEDIFENQEINKVHQLNILSEHENRLLVLNFKSNFDNLNDFVCILFPKEITFLGMYKNVKNLSTDDKTLIAEILHKTFKVDIDFEIENLKKIKRIAKYYELKSENSDFNSLNNQLNYLKSELKSNLSNTIKTSIQFDFSDELIHFIINKSHSISFVNSVLFDAYQTVSSIQNINDNFTFELFHFEMIYHEFETNLSSQNTIIESNKDKTIELLDKLENAAKKAELEGVLINGKSVAQFLNPPVSPPAITDILKKNILKIESKLVEFPHKWILIRKYLKPLREIEFKHNFILNKKIG